MPGSNRRKCANARFVAACAGMVPIDQSRQFRSSYSLRALCVVRSKSDRVESAAAGRAAPEKRPTESSGPRACCLGHAFCSDVLTLSSPNHLSDASACSRRQPRFVPPAPLPNFQRWPRRPLSLRRHRPKVHESRRYRGRLRLPPDQNRNSPCTTRSRATRCGRLTQLGSVACFDVAS